MTVTFQDHTTEEYEAEALESGAEGEIFRSHSGAHLVKLYFPAPSGDTLLVERLQAIGNLNPAKDASYWEDYFAWPEKLVIAPRVGFRMPFAKGLRTIDQFIFPTFYEKVLKPHERGWFVGRVATAIKIANAANRLSSSGLCYPDFSHKNIMVDPYDGRMVLIDCDSIIVPSKVYARVQGTSWYRAPELITGDLRIPNVRSDRHSLAVILYLWLLRWHPLVGDKIHSPDPDTDEALRFGKGALYVEHPTNPANRAKGQKYTSRLLGKDISELFRRAFVDGLFEPGQRPQPSEWQRALWNLYDRIIPCPTPSCDWHGFMAAPVRGLTCPCCEQRIQYPPTLPFLYLMRHRGTRNPEEFNLDLTAAHTVVGWPGRLLYSWHTIPNAAPIPRDPMHPPDVSAKAVLDYDPVKDQWFITNLALPDACSSSPVGSGGVWHSWPVNTSLSLANNMLLQFGPAPEHFRVRVQIAPVV